MKYFLFPLLALFLSTCSSDTQIMTKIEFDNIHLGTSAKDLIKNYGHPLTIYQYKDKEILIYEYVERFQRQTINENIRTIEARRYYFIIKNNIIVKKTMITAYPWGYDLFDYDTFFLP